MYEFMAVYPFSLGNIVIIMATLDTLLDTGAALNIEIVKNRLLYDMCTRANIII